MREGAFLAGALIALLGGATALHLVDRGAQPAVVGLDVQRRSVEDPVRRDRLRRRQDVDSHTVILDNEVGIAWS